MIMRETKTINKMTLSFILLFTGFIAPSLHLHAAPEKNQTGETRASVNFRSGNLILERVPKEFAFGTLPISSQPQSATLSPKEVYTVAITDLRGTAGGYRLTAQAKPLTSYSGDTFNGNNITASAPKTEFIGENQGEATPPVVEESAILDALDANNESVPSLIATAKAGTTEGVLSWGINYTGDNIQLSVAPTEAKATEYYTNIVWTLNDVPKD